MTYVLKYNATPLFYHPHGPTALAYAFEFASKEDAQAYADQQPGTFTLVEGFDVAEAEAELRFEAKASR